MSISNATMRVALCACALHLAGTAHARQDTPATDYNKRLKIWETISPGGDTPFGERINLYTGELTFSQTDVDFPGIGPDIALTRFTLTSQDATSKEPFPFGNWDMALPRIETLVTRATKWQTLDPATRRTTHARCTKFAAPHMDGATGMTLVTGTGDSQPLLRRVAQYTTAPSIKTSTGQPIAFTAITNANWQVGCLPATTNGQPGEGFLVVSPDGTRYSLTHLTYTEVETLLERDNDATIRTFRDLARMSVSKIEDRFGNTVSFAYQGKQLTRILASDGRRIDLAWRTDVPVVASVTMHANDATPRTWRYQYAVNGAATALTGVVLPDGSRWQYSGSIGRIFQAPGDARLAECTTRDASPLHAHAPTTGTIVSPTGLTGTFELRGTWRGRSYVPSKCDAFGGTRLVEGVPPIFGAIALTKRTMSGPGVAPQSWTYAYSPARGSTDDDPCFAARNCPETAWVDIVDPHGDRTRHTYSTRWGVGEGRQLRVDTYQGTSSLLRTETHAHASPTQGPWPTRIGASLNDATTNVARQEQWAPMNARTISQQGTDFRWRATSFDAFARPLVETRQAGGAPQKIETTAYHDVAAKWILGEVAQTTARLASEATPIVVASTSFDANAQPVQVREFGRLKQALTYRADGTVATVSDGRDAATFDVTVKFDDFKRGIPQRITFPDGHARRASVDDLGRIRHVIDETGAKTCYGYDAMGRLASVQHPSETVAGACDTASWNALVRSFVQSPSASHGLAAGHWRQEEHRGTGRKVVYYDALWRPVLTQAYDAADVAGTRSQAVTRYDAEGRVVFQSYPAREIGDVRQTLAGTRTVHDALGRVVRVERDSELGRLTTATAWLHDAAGPYTRTTDPRGHHTRTWFQMFDQPDESRPVSILHADQSITAIARDAFGKPKSITRRNATGSVSATRAYTYNGFQELCRTHEPETGDTYTGLDLAGNVAWTAAGLSLGPGCVTPAAAAARRVDRSYDARNRLVALKFPDGRGNTTHAYTPDGLPASISADNGGGQRVTTTYAYNRRRLLTSERMDHGTTAWTIGYGYDANGHLASHAYPGALHVAYAPNALGQPTRAGTFATHVRHHPDGAIAGFTYGNGLVHALTQNARHLPARSRTFHGATSILDDHYDYDGNANVVAITDGLPGHRGDRDMRYDARDRLLSVASPMYGGTIAFDYDALDNLTALTAPNRSHRYCHDARQRLAFVRSGGTSCTTGAAVAAKEYDAQGNLSRKNDIRFHFDYGNRLRATSGGVASTYVYDALGRRVRDHTTGSRDSLYMQGGQLALTHDRRTGHSTQYIHLGGRLVATRRTPVAGGSAVVEYQHTDALGTPVAVTDANRNVVERNEYEPYGRPSNKAARDGVGFTGHVEDGATGLVYMQQRYMDPMYPRFLSVDPVSAYDGDARHFNRYIYAYNNPYKFNDPDGRIANFFVKAGVDFAIEVGIQYATTGSVDLGSAALETGRGLLNPARTMQRARDLGRIAARAENTEKHHVVPKADHRASDARANMRQNGIDPNTDKGNLVSLSGDKHDVTKRESYIRSTNERIASQPNAEAIKAECCAIANELKSSSIDDLDRKFPRK